MSRPGGLSPEDRAAILAAQMRKAAEAQRLQQEQQRAQEAARQQAAARAAEASRKAAEAKPQPTYTPPHAEGSEERRKTPKVYTGPKVTVVSKVGETKPPEPTKPLVDITKGIPGPSRQAAERALVNVRSDVLKPVLETLQAGADFFESHAGFASEAEINQFLSTGGRYKDPHRYAPKNAAELFSRLALAGTSAVKGAVKDLTFPISWGISPPKTKAQQGLELMGAVFVPSPADYAVVKTLSYLGRTVKGRVLAKILVKGDAGEISDQADEILRYINQYDEIKTLNIKTSRKLQSIANDIDELKRIVPEDKLLDQAAKADDALTIFTKGKGSWRKGLGVEELMDPDNARRGVLMAKKGMRDLDDGVALLFDLDPDSPTAFMSLSPKDQVKVLKKVEEMLKFWETEGANIYTAGAAYEPELITLAKRIKSDPDLVKDVILNTDKYGLSPASLAILLEGLNRETGGHGEVSALVENEIEKLRESKKLIANIVDDLDDAAEEKEDEDQTPLVEQRQIDEPKDDTEQKPEEDTVQETEQTQEQEQVEDTEQEQEQTQEPRRDEEGRFLPRTEEAKRKGPTLRYKTGGKRRFKVEYTRRGGGRETFTVVADTYGAAMAQASRARWPGAEVNEVNLWVLLEK